MSNRYGDLEAALLAHEIMVLNLEASAVRPLEAASCVKSSACARLRHNRAQRPHRTALSVLSCCLPWQKEEELDSIVNYMTNSVPHMIQTVEHAVERCLKFTGGAEVGQRASDVAFRDLPASRCHERWTHLPSWYVIPFLVCLVCIQIGALLKVADEALAQFCGQLLAILTAIRGRCIPKTESNAPKQTGKGCPESGGESEVVLDSMTHDEPCFLSGQVTLLVVGMPTETVNSDEGWGGGLDDDHRKVSKATALWNLSVPSGCALDAAAFSRLCSRRPKLFTSQSPLYDRKRVHELRLFIIQCHRSLLPPRSCLRVRNPGKWLCAHRCRTTGLRRRRALSSSCSVSLGALWASWVCWKHRCTPQWPRQRRSSNVRGLRCLEVTQRLSQ